MACNPPSPLIRVTVASSISEMQSQRMLPCGVQTSSARCPMANLGVVPMPIRPGSYWRNPLWCEIRKRSSVVHDCPSGGRYWRSSSHTGHRAGGTSLGGYCVPQVEQMNAGMISPVWSPSPLNNDQGLSQQLTLFLDVSRDQVLQHLRCMLC